MKRLRHKIAWVCMFVFCLMILTWSAAGLSNTATPSTWTSPTSKTVQRIGTAPDIPEQPNFLNNLDCSAITYRMVGSNSMQTGCFSDTSYGMVDTDSGSVIFANTDEALPLHAYSTNEVLVPWTRSSVVLALDASPNGGSQMGLYKYLPTDLENERNYLGSIVAKRVNVPPDMTLKFSDGQIMTINSQTLAFSANGSWLVAETMRGAFVRINLATLDVTPFAPAYASLGSPALYKSSVSITSSGRFVVIANNAAQDFIVYDLQNCTIPLTNGPSSSCPHYDYWSFLSQSIDTFTGVSHVRFVGTDRISFETSLKDGKSTYELAPQASLDALIPYLALGDSYTSGEGAFDYSIGTDTPSNMCHLSSQSYPLILSRTLFGDAGHSVACSGAVIHDISPDNGASYRGQIANGVRRDKMTDGYVDQIEADYTPGILSQISFVDHYQPEVVSVSVGGNDIGFGDLVAECVAPHISLHPSDGLCYSTYEDRLELEATIDKTVRRWSSLFQQLHKASPMSRLFVIGYPQIVDDTGKCGLNVHLSKTELALSLEVVDYLNARIQQAATQAGAQYVDISHALDGHRLCETSSYNIAVNGLTSGRDAGLLGITFLGKESYHPNALGHQLIAAAILKATNNFQSSSPAQTKAPSLVAGTPSSGRATNTVVHVASPAQTIVSKGKTKQITVRLSSGSSQSGATYTTHLGSTTGAIIGNLDGDDDESVSGPIAVPPGSSSGGTTIHIIGTGLDGSSIDIVHIIYIRDSDMDADGDGITDGNDSCEYAVNSGADIDGDGIDDTCDPIIGTTGSGSSSGTTTAEQTPLYQPPSSTIHTSITNAIPSASISTNKGINTPHVLGASVASVKKKHFSVTATNPTRITWSATLGLICISVLALVLLSLTIRIIIYSVQRKRMENARAFSASALQ